MRRLAALAAVALLAASCGTSAGTVMGKDTIRVGIRTDLPGIGVRTQAGGFAGFDVDVARYIAKKLGARPEFVPILAADREKVLADDRADLVLATFSITQERKARVLFAGPYHLSYQDILVRPGETQIKNVRDLKDRRICEVQGSNAGQRVVEERKVPARLVPVPDYGACLKSLKDGQVDAITTNDIILAGLAAQDGSGLRLLNARFNEQRTGVGLRVGDVEGCEAVNRAIIDMYQDGTAKALLTRWFGKTELDLSTVAVPQFEGCA
ncbi:transporter substrate-binding domain-containing protein [Nonomuraea typhae]|uniref:transporter substrate-binding domain-containing protein n=1 Tax=Nonomuraea typhae TaxID=2603600 RepID=UPI0012F95D6C|nr:transporter substrate-binding domain-containing protein [Nonomuraea typhae]